MDSKLEIAMVSLFEAFAQVGVKYKPPVLGELSEPAPSPQQPRPPAPPSDLARRMDDLQAQNALLQEQLLAQQQALLQQQQALMELISMGKANQRTAEADAPTEKATDLRSKLGVVS